MSTRLVSSFLWIGAGVLGIGTALAFRDERVPWAVTIAIGVLAVFVGIVLLLRTVPRVARWSTTLGIAWVACYVALAVWQLGGPGGADNRRWARAHRSGRGPRRASADPGYRVSRDRLAERGSLRASEASRARRRVS